MMYPTQELKSVKVMMLLSKEMLNGRNDRSASTSLTLCWKELHTYGLLVLSAMTLNHNHIINNSTQRPCKLQNPYPELDMHPHSLH